MSILGIPTYDFVVSYESLLLEVKVNDSVFNFFTAGIKAIF